MFWFNVAFNNFSVISRRCLVVTRSSVLTFIVLLHCSIMPQTLDMIPHPVTLIYSDNGYTSPTSTLQVWVPSEEQLVPFLAALVCRCPELNPCPPVPQSGHSTYWATRAGNGCDVRTEMKLTVRHHEACRVMLNIYLMTEFSICTKHYMSHVTRKPVSGVCDQVRLKSACPADETR